MSSKKANEHVKRTVTLVDANRVSISEVNALPIEIITLDDATAQDLLDQLKIMNFHLSHMTGITVEACDLD